MDGWMRSVCYGEWKGRKESKGEEWKGEERKGRKAIHSRLTDLRYGNQQIPTSANAVAVETNRHSLCPTVESEGEVGRRCCVDSFNYLRTYDLCCDGAVKGSGGWHALGLGLRWGCGCVGILVSWGMEMETLGKGVDLEGAISV